MEIQLDILYTVDPWTMLELGELTTTVEICLCLKNKKIDKWFTQGQEPETVWIE